MRKTSFVVLLYTCAIMTGIFLTSFIPSGKESLKFPYKKQGLTEREAAVHLLSRFSYGSKPGQIEELTRMGLEHWFLAQLEGKLAEPVLDRRLDAYDALKLSNREIAAQFPRASQITRMAIRDSVIDARDANVNREAYREKLTAYLQKNGLRPQAELNRQLINQKIIRAMYANNQLHEVLTEFWFNHFNVSLSKNQCAGFILPYERDVIRPNVVGSFKHLLIATAKSPAMLIYLDNFSSSGVNEEMSRDIRQGKTPFTQRDLPAPLRPSRKSGLNENYAREVMELHTMGVDGGYTQNDVTNAAKILTGWTVYPFDNEYNQRPGNWFESMGETKLKAVGFVREGDFLFAANRHDSGEKNVLGKKFDHENGYQEGIDLLSMLAEHPSTARFISRKLATRFVADEPSQKLVDRLTETYLKSGGEIRELLKVMVSSPEFWAREAIREKTKSPFELAISSLRAIDADLSSPYPIFSWISKMGQKLYSYDAPTGFPDRGDFWINTGSLLNRMNFGLALSSGSIPGVRIKLKYPDNDIHPQHSGDALRAYGKFLLPERDLDLTLKRLSPMVEAHDPGTQSGQSRTLMNVQGKGRNTQDAMIARVVGVIIGSPEFQRK